MTQTEVKLIIPQGDMPLEQYKLHVANKLQALIWSGLDPIGPITLFNGHSVRFSVRKIYHDTNLPEGVEYDKGK